MPHRQLRRVAPFAGWPLALALAACDAAPGASVASDAGAEAAADVLLNEVSVIDHQGWEVYAPELDPLPGHQPEQIDCSIPGWFIERGFLEINTGACNYALLEHPSLLDVPKGAEVKFDLWHFDLLAAEPATAHVALLFGDTLQWEADIAIPQLGTVRTESFRATRSLAAGEPIRFHLHNHGQNTWTLGEVTALVAP